MADKELLLEMGAGGALLDPFGPGGSFPRWTDEPLASIIIWRGHLCD